MTGFLTGRRIMAVRPLSKAELKELDWSTSAFGSVGMALVLDDGSLLIPSMDEEGNGPGALFGRDKQGDYLVCIERLQSPSENGK